MSPTLRAGPRVAYLAAGAAGMICGSCLRDNALVVALQRLGVDAVLVPTYTPIRTDEPDVSLPQVFFGGVNVYLQQRVPLFRSLPKFVDRWLDWPWFIRRVTRGGATADPKLMAELTLSMLRGEHGHQRKEVERLCDFLQQTLHPDLINFSNILIAGCAAELKKRLNVPLVVTLQGDDVFLDSLPQSTRQAAIRLIQEIAEYVDAFVVFNHFYAQYMQQYLGLPSDRFHVLPLGINIADFQRLPGSKQRPAHEPLAIGYLARMAPEKGLHLLVDAFIRLRQSPTAPPARLIVAGWQGKQYQAYIDEQFQRLQAAGLEHDYEDRGEVDRAGKLRFFADIDVFSVPTIYQDAKGLYALESLAAGVPVVLPAHGAFPELIQSTHGGLLCPPHDAGALAEALARLLTDQPLRAELGTAGRSAVAERHQADAMARETLTLYQHLLQG